MVIFQTNLSKAQCPINVLGPSLLCEYLLDPNLSYFGTYTIQNFNALGTYSWSVTQSNVTLGPFVTTTPSFIVNLNNLNLPISSLQITVFYTSPNGNNCNTIIYCYNCCKGGGASQLNNSLSSSLGNQVVNGGTFVVNGVFTINNNNIVFKNVTFIMGEASEILINGNANGATFDNCTFTDCDKLWKGITVSNQGFLKFENSTIVTGAQYALNFPQGQPVLSMGTVNPVYFKDNFIAVYVPPTASTGRHVSGLYGFDIDGSSLQLPLNYLGMPITQGGRPFRAFDISNIDSVEIKNGVVHDIGQGIVVSNCKAKIINNLLFNIPQNGINIAGGGAIGNGANHRIEDNKFDNVATSNGNTAINMTQSFGTNMRAINVNRNEFNLGSTNNPPGVSSTAISVTNNLQTPTNISLDNNKIANHNVGINCSNLASSNLPTSKVIISTNIISFNQTRNWSTSICRGIVVSNCNFINIFDNTVKRDIGVLTVSGAANRLFGIDVNIASNAKIERNVLRTLGTCIRFSSANPGTSLSCNSFETSFRGVHFNNTNSNSPIPDQGTFNRPQDNKWVGFGGIPRVTSNAPITNLPTWFYRTSSVADYLLLPGTYSGNAITSQVGNGNSPICGGNSPQLIDGDNLINEMDAINLDAYYNQDPYLQLSAIQLYELLRESSVILDSFPELAAFYNATQDNFEGQYIEYLQLLEEGNFSDAFTLLNGMNPSGELQIDLKVTIEIARKFIDNENYILTSEDTSTLLPIAYKTVFRSGQAVINARAMLGLILEDILNNYRVSDVSVKNEIKYYLIGDTYYFYDGNDNPVESIEVYNTLGQLLYSSKTCAYKRNVFPISSIVRANGINSNKSFRGL
jgi:hypothetical protein